MGQGVPGLLTCRVALNQSPAEACDLPTRRFRQQDLRGHGQRLARRPAQGRGDAGGGEGTGLFGWQGLKWGPRRALSVFTWRKAPCGPGGEQTEAGQGPARGRLLALSSRGALSKAGSVRLEGKGQRNGGPGWCLLELQDEQGV